MGSAGGVKITQKQNGNILRHINRVSPPLLRKLCGGREPKSASPLGLTVTRTGHVTATGPGRCVLRLAPVG